MKTNYLLFSQNLSPFYYTLLYALYILFIYSSITSHHCQPTAVTSMSLSFTGRANVASSLLRQHDTLGATAIDQPTFHVYIVAVCYIIIMIISKIICIIAIICLTWKISEIICYNVSIFGREDTNYANYNKLLWQLSQRFCAKNNML